MGLQRSGYRKLQSHLGEGDECRGKSGSDSLLQGPDRLAGATGYGSSKRLPLFPASVNGSLSVAYSPRPAASFGGRPAAQGEAGAILGQGTHQTMLVAAQDRSFQ